jgi:DNA-binding transcriptional MocR family regulator
MSNFINAGRESRIKLAFSILAKAEAGEDIELMDLTTAVSQLLNHYHNQQCSPNEVWITHGGIDALPKLLRLLADGIEDQVKTDKIN